MGSNQDADALAAAAATSGALGAPETQGATRPRNAAGIRDRLPKLGLTEYWYPALMADKVGRRKPASVTITGRTVVFFRDERDQVAAIDNICTHRGAFMSHGTSHFKGTLTCPYHGWTFNAQGTLLAVLGEGPESELPGARGTAIRTYPTRTYQGVVFVWMGEGEPAPPEHDIPPELIDDGKYVVLTGERVWNANWRPGIENYSDAHVYYVHRNSLEMLFQAPAGLPALAHSGPHRPDIMRVENRSRSFKLGVSTVLNYADRAAGEKARDEAGQKAMARPFQDTYPALGGAKFPATDWA